MMCCYNISVLFSSFLIILLKYGEIRVCGLNLYLHCYVPLFVGNKIVNGSNILNRLVKSG